MPQVVVIGGGMAGMAAALRLAERGEHVVLVEALPQLGGVARSFLHEGRRYPLGYHHILPGDLDLRAAMVELNLWSQVRWRAQRMHFLVHGTHHRLGDPVGLARFPMSLRAKLGLGRVALTALLGASPGPELDAARWLERSLPDRDSLRFFRDLCELRYGRDLSELSAAWLHARIRAMEAAGPLGFMPGTDWTWQVTQAYATRLSALGVDVQLGTRVTGLMRGAGEHLVGVELSDGRHLPATAVVCTLPPPVLLAMAPDLPLPELRRIEYSAVLSWVVATEQRVGPDAYWTNALRPRRSWHGLFRLDRLNPSLGPRGLRLLNFAAHVMPQRQDPLWAMDDDAVKAQFVADFQRDYGATLRPRWARLSRIPTYAPVAAVGYRNPPARVAAWPGLYLAGNFRTWPKVATTGSAIASGVEAAAALLEDRGLGVRHSPRLQLVSG